MSAPTLTRRGRGAKGAAAPAAAAAAAAAADGPPAADAPSALPLWRRLLVRDATWKAEEALTALHWVRQAFGVGVGALFGAAGATGAVSALLYLLACFVLTTGYFRLYLGVDEDDLEDAPGGGSLQTEGLFSSVALFVLTWTLSYSLLHGV